jgi:hypothetical protein
LLDGTRATKEFQRGLRECLKLASLDDKSRFDAPILHQSILS